MNQKRGGVIISYAGEAVKILSGLIYTPIMLRLLGQSEYGLYQLVYSVVSYLSLLGFGFSSSYVRFFSRYKAKDEEEEIARLNGMFMTIFCVILAVCLFCGVVMVQNIHGIFGSGLTDSEYETARILMILMIIDLALSFPNSVFNCYITAHERFVFQNTLSLLHNLLNPFLTLTLLILGFGSIGMVVVTTFLTIASFAANIYYCFKKLHMRFLFRGLRLSLLKEMWVFTFFIFLNQIIDTINWGVDNFLLGRIIGTTAVAIYGVASQIHSMYRQLSISVSHVFVPTVNRIVAENNDNNELTKLFTRVGRIQFMILVLFMTGFIFFGQPFILFWAGQDYSESYYVLLLLIIPETVPLIQSLGIEIQRAKNMHKTRSVVYFFIALGNVIISIPLIRAFGPTGAALGTAIALFLGNIVFMNWYYNYRIGLDIGYFWKEIAKFIPALIIQCILGVVLNLLVSMDRIWVLLVCIAIYAIVYCINMWLLGMNDYEKGLVISMLKRLRKSDH